MERRSRLPWILVLILLAGIVGLGIAYAKTRGQRDEQARLREADRAAAEGFLAAERKSKSELRAALSSENSELRSEVARLQATVPETVVKEIIKWKTKEIPVPVDRIIRAPTTDAPQGADCAIEIAPEPMVAFQIEGSEGRLESRNGNLFAVGTASLYQTQPPPRQLLGTSPIEITGLEIVAPEKSRQWEVTLFVGAETEGIEFGGGWQGRSRWGFYAKARYDPSTTYFDNYSEGPSWNYGAGATFSFGPR